MLSRTELRVTGSTNRPAKENIWTSPPGSSSSRSGHVRALEPTPLLRNGLPSSRPGLPSAGAKGRAEAGRRPEHEQSELEPADGARPNLWPSGRPRRLGKRGRTRRRLRQFRFGTDSKPPPTRTRLVSTPEPTPKQRDVCVRVLQTSHALLIRSLPPSRPPTLNPVLCPTPKSNKRYG